MITITYSFVPLGEIFVSETLRISPPAHSDGKMHGSITTTKYFFNSSEDEKKKKEKIKFDRFVEILNLNSLIDEKKAPLKKIYKAWNNQHWYIKLCGTPPTLAKSQTEAIAQTVTITEEVFTEINIMLSKDRDDVLKKIENNTDKLELEKLKEKVLRMNYFVYQLKKHLPKQVNADEDAKVQEPSDTKNNNIQHIQVRPLPPRQFSDIPSSYADGIHNEMSGTQPLISGTTGP